MSDNDRKSTVSTVRFETPDTATPEDDLNEGGKKEVWGTRHSMALMAFLGASLLYSMRVNLSVAIVAMVGHHNTSSSGSNTSACPYPDDYTDDASSQEGEFDWDAQTRGLILSSFYYGCLVTNLLGGMAAERYGGCLVFGLSVFFSAVLTLLSPVAARASDILFIAVRVGSGLFAGVSFPALHALLSCWVLPEKRSKYTIYIYAGIQFGTVAALAVSGVLCDSDFLGGWPSVFYLFGGLGIIWSAFWFYLVRNTPEQHPRISKQELKKLKPIALAKGSVKPKSVPWLSIMTCVPLWGTLAAHTGCAWGFFTLNTELPTYLDQIQHFSLSSNGLMSALPYATMYVYSQVYGQVVDRVTKSGAMSILSIRRLSAFISGYVPMAALVGLCFVGCDRIMAVVVLCIAVGACGSSLAGYKCSHLDLSPRYAGTLMGITSTFSTVTGIVAPYLTGTLTNNNQTLEAWRTVFLIAAVIYGVSATIYIATVSTDVQPWNYSGTADENPKEKEASAAETRYNDYVLKRNTSGKY